MKAASAPSLLLVATAILIGVPLGDAASGGGSVTNALPQVIDLAVTIDNGGGCRDGTVADRSGLDRIRVTGTLSDANGEADLVGVRILVRGAANFTYEIKDSSTRWDVGTGTIDLTPDTERNSSHPDSGGTRRMNVWDDTGSLADGKIRFNAVLVLTGSDPVGLWTFTAEGLDEAGTWNPGSAPPVEALVARQEITVDLSPFSDAGVPEATAWGDWSAMPGATDVRGRNTLRVRNTGDCPDPEVYVSWDAATFAGFGKPSVVIPLAENLRYEWGSSEPSTAPSSVAFSHAVAGAGADAAATLALDGPNRALYLRYVLDSVPAVAEDLTYRQTLTVTCLDAGCTTRFA